MTMIGEKDVGEDVTQHDADVRRTDGPAQHRRSSFAASTALRVILHGRHTHNAEYKREETLARVVYRLGEQQQEDERRERLERVCRQPLDEHIGHAPEIGATTPPMVPKAVATSDAPSPMMSARRLPWMMRE